MYHPISKPARILALILLLSHTLMSCGYHPNKELIQPITHSPTPQAASLSIPSRENGAELSILPAGHAQSARRSPSDQQVCLLQPIPHQVQGPIQIAGTTHQAKPYQRTSSISGNREPTTSLAKSLANLSQTSLTKSADPGKQPAPTPPITSNNTIITITQQQALSHAKQQAKEVSIARNPNPGVSFLTAAGHQVTLLQGQGQWMAQVAEKLPLGFNRSLELPVYQAIALSAKNLAQQSPSWYKTHVQVIFPEQTDHRKGYVLIGNLGLLGGSSGKGKGKCTYGEDARVWDKGLKRWVCPGPEKHPRKSPPRRDIPRNDPPKPSSSRNDPPKPSSSKSVPPQPSFSRNSSDDWSRERERERNERQQIRVLELEALAKCRRLEDLVQAIREAYKTAFDELHFDEAEVDINTAQANIHRVQADINSAIEAISRYEAEIRQEGFTPSELYSPDPISLLQYKYNYLENERKKLCEVEREARAKRSSVEALVQAIEITYKTACSESQAGISSLQADINKAEVVIHRVQAGLHSAIEAISGYEAEIRREGFSPSDFYNSNPISLLQDRFHFLEKLRREEGFKNFVKDLKQGLEHQFLELGILESTGSSQIIIAEAAQVRKAIIAGINKIKAYQDKMIPTFQAQQYWHRLYRAWKQVKPISNGRSCSMGGM